MTDPAWELQKAIVARLKADANLIAAQGLTGEAMVLDHVPEGQAMPYTELEDGEAAEWDTGREEGGSMGYGMEHRLRFFQWSDYEGKKQAKACNRAIVESLRDCENSLNLDGHKVINMRVRLSYVLRDPDLQAYYGVVEIRAVTEEI